MWIGSLIIAGVLALAALLITEKNAVNWLSGYNSLSPEEQIAFPLKAYLRFFKRWLLSLAGSYLALDLALHFFGPQAWRTYGILYLMLGMGLFILRSAWLFQPQKKGLALFAALLMLVLSVLIGWSAQQTEIDNELVITSEKIEIQGSYGSSIPLEALSSWRLSDTLPVLRNKRYGYAVGDLRKGVFTTTEGEKVRVFLRQGQAPYLYLENRSGEKIWYGLNAQRQRQVARTLDGLQLPMR
jgi:hypothetical protein